MITTPEQMREAAIVRIDALINAANKAGLDDRKDGLRDAHHAIRAIPIAPQPDPVEHWRQEVGKLHSQVARLKHIVVTQGVEMERRLARAETAEAALAAPQTVTVTVKPLVWEAVGNPNGRYRLHSTIAWARNTCPYGPYFIGLSSSCKDGEYSWDGPMNTGCRGFSNPELAKAAAQADYEARILSAMTIQPSDPLSDPRVVALVEALTLASNRLAWAAIQFDTGTQNFITVGEWAHEALRAIGGEA